jgi:hypothetical protein
MQNPSRRDFLKLAGLASGALALTGLAPAPLRGRQPGGAAPNVIILVLDAMSARNLSLYGYKRKTTPNFERFAERATVYHNHHSGGNYTSPGTATILTGTYPWTNRAFNIGGLIEREHADHNISRARGWIPPPGLIAEPAAQLFLRPVRDLARSFPERFSLIAGDR